MRKRSYNQNLPQEFGDKNRMSEAYQQLSEAYQQYLCEIGNYPVLSREAVFDLFEQYKTTGDLNAKNRIVETHLKLVVQVVKQFVAITQSNGSSMNMLDLISEGNLGLIRAVDAYNHKTGVKFSSYSVFWIQCYARRALDSKNLMIRIPTNVASTWRKLKNVRSKVEADAQRILSNEEFEELMGVSSWSKSLQCCDEVTVISSDGIASDISEDSELTGDDLITGISKDLVINPTYSEVEATDMSSLIHDQLEGLSKKEREIIVRRFGIDGHTVETLDAIGASMGLTRERIRQVQLLALRKLHKRLKSLLTES